MIGQELIQALLHALASVTIFFIHVCTSIINRACEKLVFKPILSVSYSYILLAQGHFLLVLHCVVNDFVRG